MIFCEKSENLVFLFFGHKGQNWPKMRFFKFYEKLTIIIYFVFLHKVAGAYMLKIDPKGFCWEKFCFEVFEPRGTQDEVFQVLPKVNASYFSDYLHKLELHKDLKSTQMDLLIMTLF